MWFCEGCGDGRCVGDGGKLEWRAGGMAGRLGVAMDLQKNGRVLLR